MTRTPEELSEALYLAEKRVDLVKQAIGLGIWEWDITHDILIWDKEMFEMFDPPFWNGKVESFTRCLHPDDVAPVGEALQKAVDGEQYSYTYRIITKQGVTKHIKARGSLVSRVPTEKKMMGICYPDVEVA